MQKPMLDRNVTPMNPCRCCQNMWSQSRTALLKTSLAVFNKPSATKHTFFLKWLLIKYLPRLLGQLFQKEINPTFPFNYWLFHHNTRVGYYTRKTAWRYLFVFGSSRFHNKRLTPRPLSPLINVEMNTEVGDVAAGLPTSCLQLSKPLQSRLQRERPIDQPNGVWNLKSDQGIGEERRRARQSAFWCWGVRGEPGGEEGGRVLEYRKEERMCNK